MTAKKATYHEVRKRAKETEHRFEAVPSDLERSGIPEIRPFVLKKPLTDRFIKMARREGRT